MDVPSSKYFGNRFTAALFETLVFLQKYAHFLLLVPLAELLLFFVTTFGAHSLLLFSLFFCPFAFFVVLDLSLISPPSLSLLSSLVH